MAETVTLKIQLEEEIRRISIEKSQLSWADFHQTVASIFSLGSKAFVLRYRDQDGDLITVSSDLDFENFINEFSSATPIPRLIVDKVQDQASTPPASNPLTEPASSTEKQESGPSASQTEPEIERSPASSPTNPQADSAPNSNPDQEPSLDQIFAGFEKLHEHIKQVFEEHPEIQQEIDQIASKAEKFFSPERQGKTTGNLPELSQETRGKLEKLAEMGFNERDLNLNLLAKYHGDLEKTIQELLDRKSQPAHKTFYMSFSPASASSSSPCPRFGSRGSFGCDSPCGGGFFLFHLAKFFLFLLLGSFFLTFVGFPLISMVYRCPLMALPLLPFSFLLPRRIRRTLFFIFSITAGVSILVHHPLLVLFFLIPIIFVKIFFSILFLLSLSHHSPRRPGFAFQHHHHRRRGFVF